MTMTCITWCVMVVTVTCNVILIPNPKFKNKKINRKENRNEKIK